MFYKSKFPHEVEEQRMCVELGRYGKKGKCRLSYASTLPNYATSVQSATKNVFFCAGE